MYGPFDGGGFAHIIGFLVTGLFSLFTFLVAVALIFLLVRFLLVATKAAHIYVAKNSPAKPAAPVTAAAPVSPAAPVVAPTASAPAATKPATVAKPAAAASAAAKPATKPTAKPATKPAAGPRTPKTPPTA